MTIPRLKEQLKGLVRKRISELNPKEAYQLWAPTYDDVEDNALLFAEESCILPMLAQCSIEGKTVLDAGCGTGRYLVKLRAREPKLIIGVDFVPAMLRKAQEKLGGNARSSLQLAELEHLPFKDSSLDFLLSTLALDHLSDLLSGIAELARVLRNGGQMIISTFHPVGSELGWKRTFLRKNRNGDSNTIAVKYFGHQTSDYLKAFTLNGLNVLKMMEPRIDAGLRHFYERQSRLDLYERFKGSPMVLVFWLRKDRR